MATFKTLKKLGIFYTRYFCKMLSIKWTDYMQNEEIRFGLVLWHINHCRLFNTKSCLYIYIKYIWFVNILLIFLNEPELIFCTQLNSFKYSYVIVTILHQLFVCTHLNRYTWNVRDLFVCNFIFNF